MEHRRVSIPAGEEVASGREVLGLSNAEAFQPVSAIRLLLTCLKTASFHFSILARDSKRALRPTALAHVTIVAYAVKENFRYRDRRVTDLP